MFQCLLEDNINTLQNDLKELEPKDRIKARLIDLVSYASDAGFYYLRPKAVVLPVSDEEIKMLFKFADQYQIPLTFRAAGTSLSGQSISDGILVDLSQHWNFVRVEEKGETVRVHPGVIGAVVNSELKKYGKKSLFSGVERNCKASRIWLYIIINFIFIIKN